MRRRDAILMQFMGGAEDIGFNSIKGFERIPAKTVHAIVNKCNRNRIKNGEEPIWRDVSSYQDK